MKWLAALAMIAVPIALRKRNRPLSELEFHATRHAEEASTYIETAQEKMDSFKFAASCTDKYKAIREILAISNRARAQLGSVDDSSTQGYNELVDHLERVRNEINDIENLFSSGCILD